jgi:hypothetical protein
MQFRRLYLILLVSFGFCIPGTISAQEDSGEWHYIFAPYLLAAGLDGTVGIRGRTAEVDASFSDVLSNLEFGAFGHFEGSNDRWVVLSDFMYVGLGAGTAVPDSEIDINEWMLEGAVGHRVARNLELIAGGRYMRLDGSIEFHGPLALRVEGNRDWFDPFVGARILLPISEKASFRLRGDIGGFGVGSEFAWALTPVFGYRITQSTDLAVFYRFLDMDYENENDGFIFDILTSGPGVGVAFHF